MWLILFALACTGSAPTADDTSSTPDSGDSGVDTDTDTNPPLDNESILGDVDECGDDPYYWALTDTVFPIVATTPGVAPSLPYELREIRVQQANGAGILSRPCDARTRIRVLAWVDDDGIPDDGVGPQGWPAPTAVAEVSMSGVGLDEVEWVTAAFDPPVRIEAGGFIMVGFEVDEVPGDTSVACLRGCGDLFAWHYFAEGNIFSADPGWYSAEASPNMELVVGY